MGDVAWYQTTVAEANTLTDKLSAIGWTVAAVALYVIVCMSLHSIGRRRGIRNSWLSWVPVCGLWVLGSISDQYQYLVKAKIRSRRKILPLLSVATMAVYLAGAYCVYLSEVRGYITATTTKIPMLLAFISVAMVLAGLAFLAVHLYMCCYDLFRSCDPDNGKLFLVLTILFPGAFPFIAFAIRKRDGGMPPRKKQPEMPIEEAIEEPEEIEENTEETEGGISDEQEIPVADA